MVEQAVADKVLKAARMVVTDGIGEGRPAHGFFIIVGDTNEILADERRDPQRRDAKLCRYGDFKTYLDRRSDDLQINDCLGERKRIFFNLIQEDGGVVVDGKSGQVCCGGFFVHDLTSGIGTGGARTKAASAMATQANGCYVVLASQTICGSVERIIPTDAALTIFNQSGEPIEIPVRVPETVPVQSFEQWLHPLKFDADLRRYDEDFVEGTRQWILDDIQSWRSDLVGSRCRVLLAGPGFGKTTIAARLHQEMTGVLAIHLCRHNDSFKRDPRRMITSIAYQIANRLPQFDEAVRKVREAEGGATDAYSLRKTARELADCLLFNPLREMQPPSQYDHHGRHVIIIDALDEAEHDTKSDLLDLVAFDFRKLPPWVALLVTARPEVGIIKTLAPLRPTVLDAKVNREKCDADVRVYLRRILEPRYKNEGSLSKAIETIAAKSEGLFLYLYYIRDTLESGDDIDALPIGLPGVYQKELELVLGSAGLGDENNQTRRVVEAIIAAQVPVHVSEELPGLSGVPHDAVRELVKPLSRLLPVRDKYRVHIFHKSFVDWLTGDGFDRTFDRSEFIVDRRAAHRRLATACGLPLMRLLREEADRFESDAHAVAALEEFVKAQGSVVDDSLQSLAPDEYALRWSVLHLVEAGGLEEVSLALLYSLRFLFKRAPQINTLISDAALLLPTTAFLHLALLLAQNHVRLHGEKWLPEELWQRLLSPAETREIVDLKRLARDAQIKAGANLMFSARRAYFTAADSPLHCVLDGHTCKVKGVTGFVDAQGRTRVASCSDDNAVRIWDPIKGGEAIHLLEGHSLAVNGVTAFEDTKGHTWVASCSDDKTVRIWDPVEGGKAVRVLEGHSSCVLGVTSFVGATGITWVASCSDDKTVRIWDPIQGREVHMLGGHGGHSSRVTGVAAFVDTEGNTRVVSCSDDMTVRIWDATYGGNAVHVLKGHKRAVIGVTADVGATGHKWVASFSRDTTVRIWDPVKGTAVHVLRGHSRAVTGVTAFMDAENHTLLASCSADQSVRIWDLMEGGRQVHVLKGHTGWVNGVTMFVDAKHQTWVTSCSEDATIRIWDAIKGGEAVQVLDGHSNDVKSVTVFADALGRRWVASCSSDKTVRIWEPMKGGEAPRVSEGHSRKVIGVTPFVDSKGHTLVASCAWDNTVRIWDPINGGHSVHVHNGHSSFCSGVTAFKDAKHHTWLATWSNDKTICIWDPIKSIGVTHVLKGHRDSVSDVTAFVDAEGCTWLASCSHDKTVRIWDPMNGGKAKKRVLRGHTARVNRVTFFRDAEDQTWVVTCSWDKTVRIWQPTNSGEAVNVLKGHKKKVNDVTAFVNAHGQARVASCSDDETVRIWDPIEGRKAVHVLKGHKHDVYSVTSFVDAEGCKWVASCSMDKTVLIWDPIKGGNAAQVLKGHSSHVNGVAAFVVSKGVDTWVASWSDDLTVRIWDALNGGVQIFLIPLESPAATITTLSACSSLGADRVCLVIGHEDGHLSYWDQTRHSDEHNIARLSLFAKAYLLRAWTLVLLGACGCMFVLVTVVVIVPRAAFEL